MEERPATSRGRAPWFWARRELAARWKAIVVLGLLAGIAGGVSLAAIAGARRTEAAFGRYKAATGAPDALVFGTQVGGHHVDYGPVRRLPEVADAGEFALAGVFVRGVGRGALGALAPADAHLYRTISRPLLESGRLPNPRRVDEIVVNRNAAAKYGIAVGDRLTVVTSSNLAAFYGQAPAKGGPTIRTRVVGIGDSTMDQVFLANEPGFITSGALLERYGTVIQSANGDGLQVPAGRIAMATNLVVRLRPGTDLATFHRDVARVLRVENDNGRLVPGRDVPIRDLVEDDKRIEHATDLERVGLLLFALVAALASLVLVGQAIARAVYAMAEATPTVRALGMVRWEIVRSLLIPYGPVAILGAVVAVAFAIALSPLFPVGLAGRIDPDKGVHVDSVVLVVGGVTVAIAVLVAAGFAAWRASAAQRRELRQRTSSIARAARAVLPLPIGLGAGLAVDRGRGPRSLPTRPAIVGAVAAVAGVVGCFGLLHGIDDALATPARSGQVWNVGAVPESVKQFDQLRTIVRDDHGSRAAAVLERAPMTVAGTGIPVYAVTPVKGQRPFPLISGRAPRGPHEVALGPATARAMHRGIGERIRLRSGDNPAVRMTVTGTVLLPQDAHSSFDQGALVTPAGLTGITRQPPTARYEEEDVTFVAYYPSHPQAAMRTLHRRTGAEVGGATMPQDVLNLRNVRPLPRALSVFLVLLGVAALGHALVTAVRRRRGELAVLRALGFTPRQTAATILAQAGTVALVGLLVGIPLGVILGRMSWEWVADATPLVFSPPVAIAVILLAIPTTIVVANLLAAGPARHAARTRPAGVLRAE
jgi:hypothetical protein